MALPTLLQYTFRCSLMEDLYDEIKYKGWCLRAQARFLIWTRGTGGGRYCLAKMTLPESRRKVFYKVRVVGSACETYRKASVAGCAAAEYLEGAKLAK
jgi:hypothetical protein